MSGSMAGYETRAAAPKQYFLFLYSYYTTSKKRLLLLSLIRYNYSKYIIHASSTIHFDVY